VSGGPRNRKTGQIFAKNRKTDQKIGKNRKTALKIDKNRKKTFFLVQVFIAHLY
jgi:hypothetical protein